MRSIWTPGMPGTTRSAPESRACQYGYNVGCLEGIDPFPLENVPVVDGVNHQGGTMRSIHHTMAAAATLALAACSATTHFAAVQPETKLALAKSTATEVPRSEKLATTSFGNYVFRAEAPGTEPLYGILPLKFNGGYLAADILFFAPAAFFNLREPFAQYEFDLARRQVKYRQAESQAWTMYTPSEAEAQRARTALGPK